MNPTPKKPENPQEPKAPSILDELHGVRALRDEIKLQAHLLKAEARERFVALDQQWSDVDAKVEVLEQESREAARKLLEASKGLVDELREQYRQFKSGRPS